MAFRSTVEAWPALGSTELENAFFASKAGFSGARAQKAVSRETLASQN